MTNLTLHPFQEESQGLALFHDGSLTFPEAVSGLIHQSLGNGLAPVFTEVPLGGASANGRRFEGRFLLHGAPIYGTGVAANLLNDNSSLILASAPNLSPAAVQTASADFPTDEDSVHATVLGMLKLPGSTADVSFGPSVPTYFPKSADELVPVVALTVRINGLNYSAIADEHHLYVMNNRFFSATGTATIYNQSANDGKTVSYSLQDLDSDGTLTSPNLQTFLPDGYTRAQESNETFDYPAGDPRFQEANAYSHTDNHFRWMETIGGQTYGDLPIHIELHQLPGGTPDNALFQPGDPSSGTPFQIIIGDGDGTVLANLPTDFDVPAHESGHYFVYKYLQTVSGESLAVHEGMADLFVFLQKGVRGSAKAACLGESICPQGSTACIQPGECLRTADNTWAFGDANWVEWSQQLGGDNCGIDDETACGHKHGQVLSGLVWDLVKNHDMSAADAATLTMTAVSYFKVDSGFRDYLLALLTADKSAFNCKYDDALHKYMNARALNTLISDVTSGCGNLPALTGTGNLGGLTNASGGSTTASSSSHSSASGGGGLLGSCAVIGEAGPAAKAAMLLLALLPLLVGVAGPRLAAARARRRK